ncbi:MAG: hypothetical protein Q9202_003398 [Teloschistes flavicans]
MLSARQLRHGQQRCTFVFRTKSPCRAISTSPRTLDLQAQHLQSLRKHGARIKAFSTVTFPRSLILFTYIRPQRITILPTMGSLTQQRPHAGHSHGHHHRHDNTYLTSTNKKDAGVRITRIGLYVNLLMAICKGTAGYVFHSQALVADAFHAMTDLISDFMTLGTVAWSLKPPTPRFPRGYGKIESLGSLGVSGLLLTGGVLMGFNACGVLYSQFFIDAAHAAHDHSHGGIFGHSHSHGAADMGPNINAAWVAAASIAVKEYLYRATIKVARERKSSVLASNAVHHRIDSLTSIVALVAITGSHLFNGTSWLDPVGGLIVSFMVVRAGWSNTGQALLELADVGVDSEMKASVRKAASKALAFSASDPNATVLPGRWQNQVEVRDVQGVKAGQTYLMDIELAVPDSWTVQQTRLIEESVRTIVGSKVRGVRRVKVRIVPLEGHGQDFSDEFIAADVSPRSSPELEDEAGKDHQHEHKRDKDS